MSIIRRAPATSVSPPALNSGPWPPNVPAPKLRAGTFRPERPSVRYSIGVFLARTGSGDRRAGGAALEGEAEERQGQGRGRDGGGDQGHGRETRAMGDDGSA